VKYKTKKERITLFNTSSIDMAEKYSCLRAKGNATFCRGGERAGAIPKRYTTKIKVYGKAILVITESV